MSIVAPIRGSHRLYDDASPTIYYINTITQRKLTAREKEGVQVGTEFDALRNIPIRVTRYKIKHVG